MLEILFTVVITLVLITIWRRKRSARETQEVWKEEPGRSPASAVVVERFDEMDRFVRLAKCHCGGSPSVVSEGSKTIDGQKVKVIRADCDDCEDELYFFFKMSRVIH